MSAKKLRNRGSQLVPRDVFDLLAAARFDPGAAAVLREQLERMAAGEGQRNRV